MEQLVDELERNYRETQERMSDPAVYNDHREAAEVGRRLKELESAVQARRAVARGRRRSRRRALATRSSRRWSPSTRRRSRGSRRS